MEQLGIAKTKIEKGGCYGVRDEAGESDGVNFILIQQIIFKNQLYAGSFLSIGFRSQAETVFALVESKSVAKGSQGDRLLP